MKLFLDTSQRETITIGFGAQRWTTSAREEKSQKLLPFIDEILKKERKSLKDISEIEVNSGPGSFTGLRVGVAVANTLGWVLGVKVNGKDIRKGEMVDIKYDI